MNPALIEMLTGIVIAAFCLGGVFGVTLTLHFSNKQSKQQEYRK